MRRRRRWSRRLFRVSRPPASATCPSGVRPHLSPPHDSQPAHSLPACLPTGTATCLPPVLACLPACLTPPPLAPSLPCARLLWLLQARTATTSTRWGTRPPRSPRAPRSHPHTHTTTTTCAAPRARRTWCLWTAACGRWPPSPSCPRATSTSSPHGPCQNEGGREHQDCEGEQQEEEAAAIAAATQGVTTR